jgi:phosphoenolpyruvate carboxylase
MNKFAEFVEDPKFRNDMLTLVLTDYRICTNKIEMIMGDSIESRRVSKLEDNKLRGHALKVLHEIQHDYLRHWRNIKDSDPHEGDKLLLQLLLLVNALAGGLKNTG